MVDPNTVTVEFPAAIAGKASIVGAAGAQTISKTVQNLGTKTSNFSINYDSGSVINVTFGGSCALSSISGTLTSGYEASMRMFIAVTAGTPSFPTSVKWAGGTMPVWSGNQDFVELTTIDGGTTWLETARSLAIA